MRNGLGPGAALLAGFLGALPAAAGAADGPAAEHGREIAERLCAGCHAVGETGDSPEAAAPPFRTLHEKWPVEYLAEALAEGIVVGHEADVSMPEFRFEPAEIDALIAYLQAFEAGS
ncbi:MAG: cytochrome c [Azospirillaceae bacterium]